MQAHRFGETVLIVCELVWLCACVAVCTLRCGVGEGDIHTQQNVKTRRAKLMLSWLALKKRTICIHNFLLSLSNSPVTLKMGHNHYTWFEYVKLKGYWYHAQLQRSENDTLTLTVSDKKLRRLWVFCKGRRSINYLPWMIHERYLKKKKKVHDCVQRYIICNNHTKFEFDLRTCQENVIFSFIFLKALWPWNLIMVIENNESGMRMSSMDGR